MSTVTSHISRLLDPVTEAFTPELAEKLANLRADAQLQSRIDYLRTGANHGTLSPAEEAEYRGIVQAMDFLSIIQLKARRFLAQRS